MNGAAAGWAGESAPAVDLQLLSEIARFAVAVDEVPQRGPALFDGARQHLLDRDRKPPVALARDPSAGPPGMDAAHEKRLVGVDVADADDHPAIHHEALYRHPAPDRPVVSVCGDGAFFMHASVLGTAVEYSIPVVWVVWNNFAYASIRGLQRGYLGNRELATDFHHPETGEPYNPDFVAMARAAGVDGVTIKNPDDLGDAIRTGIESNRPYLIDAHISGDLNPPGAGVWELPGIGVNRPGIGERFVPDN